MYRISDRHPWRNLLTNVNRTILRYANEVSKSPRKVEKGLTM